jgi:holo-[acyl-carrier protein] synthase
MRILGVGVDIVAISRVRGLHDRHPERFAARLLSEPELQEWARLQDKVVFLAKRFAAKEAVAKALGTGFSQGIGFRDITITHDPLGRPGVRLSGKAAQRFGAQGAIEVHLSLSDERDHAVASAMIVTV